MSLTDAKRFELHKTLREELGAEAADLLMEYLPSSGWSDVARQRDIDGTHETIRHSCNQVKSDLIAYIETRFNQQNKWIISMLTVNTMALLSLMVTVALKL